MVDVANQIEVIEQKAVTLKRQVSQQIRSIGLLGIDAISCLVRKNT